MRAAGRGSTLVERAVDRLLAGPAHTLELARDILRLSGPPGAVSAAVATLFSGDRRLSVDPAGVWSVGPPGLLPLLQDLRCAVVDVETTGGTFEHGHRIIDVAVVAVDGGLVGPVWRTLVNPGRSVPRGIRLLTGITDAMLAGAPWFDHIATDLVDRLEGRVFVAHNARYDWGFVSAEVAHALGAVPEVRRLCTVHMARRLLPGLRRRNLDVLSRHYGIANHARHRADGDALATARVLVRLLEEARDRGLRDLEALERFLFDAPVGRRARRRPPVEDARGREAAGAP